MSSIDEIETLEALKAEIKRLKDANLSLTIKFNRFKTRTISETANDYVSVISHSNIPIVNPDTTIASIAYIPSQLNNAYGISNIVTPNNSLRGTGIKVGIIIAYHYANLQSDFDRFCRFYSLPGCRLTIKTQKGAKSNSEWALEECLDVQMVHISAPGASIYVYEAKTSNMTDIINAIKDATTDGMDIISMSFGTSEYSTQSNSIFTGNKTCYLSSSGDTSNQVSYPSSSNNVLAIGGTNLQLSNGVRLSETVWNSSGGGVSLYTAKPNFQTGLNLSYSTRSVPDISLVADPRTCVYMICSIYSLSPIGLGGTSASCPYFAGFLATVNQLRVVANKHKLTTLTGFPNNLQSMLYLNIYPNTKPAIYDIISGVNSIFQASTGYDIISGIGSFNAVPMCNALVAL